MSIHKFGKVAYEAYCESSDNKSLISGCELPKWDDLKVEIQNAWIDSAIAVTRFWETATK